jgi:hypothetical protein
LATDGDTDSASSACVITLLNVLISAGPQAPTSLPARCLCVDVRCGCTWQPSPPSPRRYPSCGGHECTMGNRSQCDEPNDVGMNRMIGTEAGLSVQTEGTMVRLPNQHSADWLPNFSFSCPLFISINRLDKAPLISEAHIYFLRAQFLVSLFDGLEGYTFNTLVVQKPSAGSTEPVRAPNSLE